MSGNAEVLEALQLLASKVVSYYLSFEVRA